MLLPVLPFPESAALAIEGLRNDPATSAISLTPVGVGPLKFAYNGMAADPCVSVALSFSGLQPGWRMAVQSHKDTFETSDGTFTVGWRSGYDDGNNVYACVPAATIAEGAIAKPITVSLSLALAVFAPAEAKPIVRTASLQPFDVPGVGSCRFQLAFRSDKYVLACKAPVWFPEQGRIVTSNIPDWPIVTLVYPWTPLNLLPGMSPVYKWASTPFDAQVIGAFDQSAEMEFRPEKQIAVLRREITVQAPAGVR